jgi:tetratricopeptide (TPR) repeat protein
MSDCAARTAPENQEQNDRANQILDTAMSNLVPPLDKAYLLSLKATRLESRGRPDEAIKVRQLLAAELQKLERQEVANNLALLRMNHRTARISATERDRVSALIAKAMDDEVLFDTLRSIEATNASSMSTQSAPEMAAILRDLREQVVLRIEERFAIDIAALVKVLQSDKQADAERMSSQLKIIYPTLGYQRRIDATVAAFSNRNQSMPLAPDGQGPSIAYDTSDLTEDQRFAMASQAMASGRPDEAVRLLRSVPEVSRSAELKRRLDEAESVHIRDLRLRVRDLLQRASSRSNPTERAGDYREALEVLNFILAEYPKNSARKQIERNIRNIQFNLSQMNKKEQLP